MDWATLDDLIPKDREAHDGRLHTEVVSLARGEGFAVDAAVPGQHWPETDPPGGDFRIGVTSSRKRWDNEGLSFGRFFEDLEHKARGAPSETKIRLVITLHDVCSVGKDTDAYVGFVEDVPGLEWEVFLVGAQALALREHRRYPELEEDRGGRHLLGEFALGLILEVWSAEEATRFVPHGPPGLAVLRSETHHRGVIGTLAEYIDRLEQLRRMTRGVPAAPSRPTEVDHSQMHDQARQLLRRMVGNDGIEFRPQQWEAIEKLVVDRKNVLLVQRTGWGKSAVYMIATKLFRDSGGGPSILISPLISLMRNQVEMAERAGIKAATMNSANESQHGAIITALGEGRLDMLLVSPEWSMKPEFFNRVLGLLHEYPPSLLVVDEAHCITDWGHDFRPDYRRIGELLRILPTGTPVLAATATATERVRNDIQVQFGADLVPFAGGLARPGLKLSVLDGADRATRLAAILEVVRRNEGSGIVYCLTRYDTHEVAGWLQSQGVDAEAYHAEVEPEKRQELEERLIASDVDVVAATSALGMGFDKPDLSFVIHYQSPPSVIAYYQQVGRAGRGVPRAEGVLMHSPGDALIHHHFINSAFPDPEALQAVFDAIPTSGGIWASLIGQRTNIDLSRLNQMILKMLAVEGAIENHNGRWHRTGRPWSPDLERPRRISAQRVKEREAMDFYAATDGCRMQFLLVQLDDPDPQPCGECDNCTGQPLTAPAVDVAGDAASRLRERAITITPRVKMPYVNGRPGKWFRREYRTERGRASTVVPGGRLADEVMEDREKGSFRDASVDSLADVATGWRMSPKPRWVTAVPSRRRPELVPDLARRLAQRLGLPFIPILSLTKDTAPQEEMENETLQYFNVAGAFEAAGRCPSSPVLLVDDFVASAWTITMAGHSLRKGGAGPVFPLALARVVFR